MSPLRIGVLASPVTGYAPRRLCEETEVRGHVPVPLDARGLVAAGRQAWAEKLDGVLHVLSTDFPDGLDALAAAGLPHLNSAEACRRSADKYLTYLAFVTYAVPTPCSRICIDDAELLEAGGAYGWPMVIKQPDGSGGRQVALVESPGDLVRRLPVLRRRGQRLVAQKFVASSFGTDLRVVVVAGRVVAAGRRVGPPGEFRSNLAQGGRGILAVPTAEEAGVAVAAAAAVGLDIAGVDLLDGPQGPLVVETNSFPGLDAIEGLTGVNVARSMVEALEDRVRTEPEVPAAMGAGSG